MITRIFLISATLHPKVIYNCRPLVNAYFPLKEILFQKTAKLTRTDLELVVEYDDKTCELNGVINQNNKVIREEKLNKDDMARIKSYPQIGKESFIQNAAKQLIVKLLTNYSGKKIGWGILTGIRPVKLLELMNEQKLSKQVQLEILTNKYLVAKEKSSLLLNITEIQKPYLTKIKKNHRFLSVYISVPFCPTRCTYCSFPSQSTPEEKVLTAYLAGLIKEIKLCGSMMQEHELQADNIYIGGGTPTVLSLIQLEYLMEVIVKEIPLTEECELTVEAGRPDTISESKLRLLTSYKVNRISINPQSMHDKTLKVIGRDHSTADIVNSFALARETAPWSINMDIILGLPGEASADMIETVERVLNLKPDNLTVHAFALKRGSQQWNEGQFSLEEKLQNTQSVIHKMIKEKDYTPYYLYRQKNIADNLENIGYSLPGKECRYNIAVIAEKQNILGIGAGATSKILNLQEQTHTNLFQTINIDLYLERVEDFNDKRKIILQENYLNRLEN